MTFPDFLGYLSAARKKEKEKFNEELKASAFTGWQIYTLITSFLQDSKSKKEPMKFIEYAGSLGVLSADEKEYLQLMKKVEKIQAKHEAARNIEKAENIVQLFREERKGNKGKKV